MTSIDEIICIVTELCRGIVANPKSIVIKETSTLHTINLRCYSHPEDTMKLVGKRGATAKAIEQIGEKMGSSLQMNVRFKVEPTERIQQSWLEYKPNPDYLADNELAILERIGKLIYDDGVTVNAVKVANDSTALIMSSDVQFGKQYDKELETDLTTVFEAIGKNNGQNLYVEIGNNL